MPPFIIYALPRSRTVWLSKFLTYGRFHCYHDIVVNLHTVTDLRAFFAIPCTGTAETGMVDGWKLVKKLVPNAKIVVIKRPIEEVKSSLAKFGINWNDDLTRRDALLDEVSQEDGVLTVSFDDLNTEETCKKIFEHCLGISFDRDWWLTLKDANIQIDMAKRLKTLERNRGKIEALKAEVMAA